MPELIEVEMYRRAAEPCIGRLITSTFVAPGYGRGVGGVEIGSALVGARVEGVGRLGKLAWIDVDTGDRLGLRFGMTGRLVVDGSGPISELLYGPRAADDPDRWERFSLGFAGGSTLSISDPRRFGGVELNPDTAGLGPDASTVTVDDVARSLESSSALKAVLLDQRRIAGIGNLLADEILWRRGLMPSRPASSVDRQGAASLARAIRSTIAQLTRRGGSHRGDHVAQRAPGGRCPRDGAELRRDTIAGRTTWWCPVHQQ